MLSISMPRGDLVKRRIAVRDSDTGEMTDVSFDEIYLTVKQAYKDADYVFQKRLSSGEITKDAEGYYCFTILPEDTETLPFGDYDFDIELYKEGEIKQTTVGKLVLTKEITFVSNEEL